MRWRVVIVLLVLTASGAAAYFGGWHDRGAGSGDPRYDEIAAMIDDNLHWGRHFTRAVTAETIAQTRNHLVPADIPVLIRMLEDERGSAAAAAGGLLTTFGEAARPADALEAMLVQQMAAVHEAAIRCLARAAECTEHPQIEALYLRQAARLMHLFARQTEALDRRRIAAEDRAETRERSEHLEERSWRAESVHAKRLGEPAPERPPRGPCIWPAWPVQRKESKGVANGTGRGVNGRRRNGPAPPFAQ